MQAVKIGWVGQTFAMARCSESNIKGKKTRNRIKKEERKSMVESFINKYREQNNGNFPSLNLTHKDVGGSFYTVREIVRELIQENRVLAPGSSHSPVLSLEYSEDMVHQPPLGSLSLDPADAFTVEINGHGTHKSGGEEMDAFTVEINGYETHISGDEEMDDIHIIKESEKLNYETVTVSSELTATGDANISISHEQDIVKSVNKVSENKEVGFSVLEHSTLSDANLSADNVQVAILDHGHLKSKNHLDSVYDTSKTANTGSTEIDQLTALTSASSSSVWGSVYLSEDDHYLAATMKTEVTSIMGLKKSESMETSTLDSREQTEIKKCDDNDVHEGLSKLGVVEDPLSSFHSAPYPITKSGVEVQDNGSISSTSCEVEYTSILKEERTNISVETSSPSLDEINQQHSISPYVSVKEAEEHTGQPALDVSNNHTPHAANEVKPFHSSVDDSLKSPVTPGVTSEFFTCFTEQVEPYMKSASLSESKSPSNVSESGSPLLESMKSGKPRSKIERPHAAEEINPIVSAVKQFIRAFVKFLMSDF